MLFCKTISASTVVAISPIPGYRTLHNLTLTIKCAEYLCSRQWGDLTFPTPFGRDAFPEERYIAELDAKSGSSLKLTILNQYGNIWTMVAGGGASVVYR